MQEKVNSDLGSDRRKTGTKSRGAGALATRVVQPKGQHVLPNQNIEPLLNIDEMAAYVRSTPEALRMQRHRRQAPGSLGVKVGSRLLFDPVVVRAWMADELEASR